MALMDRSKETHLPYIKNLTFWGHFFIAVLLIFSICFYAERVLYYDSAYQFFKLINSESYNIEADRWSIILVQTLPLIAIKAGLSLKTVLITFSFSYILIGYIVFLINVYVLKNIPAGMAVLFLYTLCIRDSFFYSGTELPLGMLFTTTFYAWLFYPKNAEYSIHPATFIFVGLLLLLICFFFHPMTFFSIIFIVGFYFIETKDYKNPTIHSIIVLTVLLYLSKALFTDSDSYEGNLFGQLKVTPKLLSQLIHLNSTKFFVHHLPNLYLFVGLLIFIITAFYIQKKNWLSLLWFLSNTGGFLLVCFIAFNKGDSFIAMEKYFMPLSLLVAVPFLHSIITTEKFKMIGLLICLLVFVRGIYGIYTAKSFYSSHLEYIDALIHFATATHNTHKLLLLEDHVNQNYTTWACATETLLRSASQGNSPQTTIYLVQQNEINDIDTHEASLFLCVPFYRDWNINTLNKRYFNLPSENYVLDVKSIH